MTEPINAAQMLGSTTLLMNKLTGSILRETELGVREILRNPDGLMPVQVNDRVKAYVAVKIEEQAAIDVLARLQYSKARNKSSYMSGELPSESNMSALSVVATDKAKEVALKRWRAWQRGRGTYDYEVEAAVKEARGIMESAATDRYTNYMRALALEDEKRSGAVTIENGEPRGQVRIVRVPKGDGCKYCKEMAYMTDGITSFHDGCDCKGVPVFPDQTLSSPGLEEGRRLVTGKNRDGSPVEGWEDSDRSKAAEAVEASRSGNYSQPTLAELFVG